MCIINKGVDNMASFKSFALEEQMLNAIKAIGYQEPSKVQELVIPRVLRHESLVVSSETGSGKTHAFLIPIMQEIKEEVNQIQAIILTPTRELAKQTYDFAKELGNFYPDIRIQLMTSQVEKSRNVSKLTNSPQLIIATPGRLIDLGVNENMKFSEVKYLVLDEADMLMELGFVEDIDLLLNEVSNASKLVFSATINSKLAHLIEKYIGAASVISLDNLTNSNVEHLAIDIRHQDINRAVCDFIDIVQPYFLMIFSSKKENVKKIYQNLKENGYKVATLHGDLEKRERKNVMKRIRADEFPIVVCSDMAARGLDILDVSEVLNVDLPHDLSFYFHRAGRTGRFDKLGKCYTFYDDDSVKEILKLQEQGVDFKFLVLKNSELKAGKAPDKKAKFKKKVDVELEKDIKRAISETKSTKVKPGYKKAVKNAVAKVKRKHHRKMIKEKIREQRVKRYKEEKKHE